uniref:Fizzy/cell division cycle 20 related 1b n=1 Tax=Oryzias sinensis TaxID=183150 RepID=A0A8C7YPA8_9TELE
MDQEYERRLLRQINHQNLPSKACLTKSLGAACSPVSVKSGDRFIPTRAGSNWSISFHYANENCRSPSQNYKAKDAGSDTGKDAVAYAALLRNELLGAGIDSVPDPHGDDRRHAVLTQDSRGLFRYTVHTKRVPFDSDNEVSPYSLSPLSNKSHKLLRSPRKPARKISKIPFKVLDAPELQDDFYLNLVDWSAGNLLSVGLGACVYLWSACTSQVTRLCDLSVDGDSVTSVCWNERGSLVSVGTHKGYVQIWDAAGGRKLTSLEGHSARVGALAWNGEQLSSGSRDRVILQRDVRTPPSAERRLQGHRQEVCGLKWSPDHQHLASGGNDNKVSIKTTLKCRSPPGRVSRRRGHRYRSRRRDSALLERLQQNALHQGTVKEAAGVEPSTRLQTFSMSTPHAPTFFSQLFLRHMFYLHKFDFEIL